MTGLEALKTIGNKKYTTTVADITGFERITISVKQDNKKEYQAIEQALKALEIISKAYGDYANHIISEYELIMVVGENITY